MAANLVTRAEYKAYVGIKSDNQDTEIDSLIPKVSALIKNYCRRTFVDWVDEPKVEVFNGGGYFILPQETPVISVLSLEKSTDYGKTYSALEEYVDYVLDAESDNIASLASAGFEKQINGYKLTYFAGFETVPQDLKLVTFDLVSYYMKNDAVSHMQKTTASGSLQLEYMTSAQFPSHIARVLNLYKQSWD